VRSIDIETAGPLLRLSLMFTLGKVRACAKEKHHGNQHTRTKFFR
jgi:hypothetical protein